MSTASKRRIVMPTQSMAVRLLATIATIFYVMSAAGSASAAPAPAWGLRTLALPTNFVPGDESGDDAYEVAVTNIGAEASDGGPVTIVDTLPSGLTVKSVQFFVYLPLLKSVGDWSSSFCQTARSGERETVSCTAPEEFFGMHLSVLKPGEMLRMVVNVAVPASVSGSLTNRAEAEGGGAPKASAQVNNEANSASPVPGLTEFTADLTDREGRRVTQAGAHPYEFTTDFALSTVRGGEGYPAPTGGDPKNVNVALPPGLVGNPAAASRCTAEEFNTPGPGSDIEHPYNNCPDGSVVGAIYVLTEGHIPYLLPVYDLVPPDGMPAQFGFQVLGLPFYIDTAVRSGSDYGITAYLRNVSEVQRLVAGSLTLWGTPTDSSHDPMRGRCLGQGFSMGSCSAGVAEKPFLRLPTSCGVSMTTTMQLDTWNEPDVWLPSRSSLQGVPSGCASLDFTPTVSIQPDTAVADSPAGLRVDLDIPQSEATNGLAQADLKDAVVSMPVGLEVNAAVANGLSGCTPSEIGIGQEGPAACPATARIGDVTLETPLLTSPLTGGVYVAQQEANPFGSLLALYIVAEGSGVAVKLAGRVTPDSSTGQLTVTFDNNPQLPFSHLKLNLYGGQRSALSTPALCGRYATTATLTPWSAPDSGPPVVSSSPFEIVSRCADGFAPTFTAGTVSSRAASFSPLLLSLSRQDGEQEFGSIATTLPAGLTAMISKVAECGEPQADLGNCSALSQIGHVTVTSGVGNEPVILPQAGEPQDPVYLTGPYGGAPFGLSIVVPAHAGPFDLDEGGHPVVVRAALHIDPRTAQVTVLSGPIPSRLRGIALSIKSINIVVDREGFTLNPTNCAPMLLNGTITSTQGATAAVGSPFQATECRSLPFKPSFSARTQAKSSKAKGASLHVTINSGAGQANIKSVHVVLPGKLPARLATLNQACTEAQFNANPAGCPAASKVGTAKAYTPVLPVPLTGPAYFVSHGGAAFPDLVVVLQGYGVTIDLVGNTFISKKGITSSTFGSVPDVPITRFDLNLPEAANSAFAANGNLCKGRLAMPTTITGQNGKQIKRNTRIAVSGCRKAKRHHRKAHHRRRRHG